MRKECGVMKEGNDATTIERRGSSGIGNVKAGRTEASVQLRWRYWELTRCQLA